jgi:hypothetical protein
MEPRPTGEGVASVRLDLDPDELQLLRTALELLEDTLGREEAEELAQVQAILARIRSASA